MLAIIIWLKKYVDKLYYSKYTLGERGALIRTMFPWITKVWEYKTLESFLITTSLAEIDQLTWAIMSYYWWEVERLTLKWEFEWIRRYQGLVDFCQSIQDFSKENLYLK